MIEANYSGKPQVVVLGSYHPPRDEAFKAACRAFEKTNADRIHPHTYEFVNAVPDTSVFVLRKGDPPGVPNHVLQANELVHMLSLRNTQRGSGFAYVVADDNAVGPHTAGEITYLTKLRIPIVASDEITQFRNVPKNAQTLIHDAIQGILPLEDINQVNLDSLAGRLRHAPFITYTEGDKTILQNVHRAAIRDQQYGRDLQHVLVTSNNAIKREAVKQAMIDVNGSQPFLLESIDAHAPGIPEQPYEMQGMEGARGRVLDGLDQTSGYAYSLIVGIENGVVFLDSDMYQPGKTAEPGMWVPSRYLRTDPDSVLAADVAFVSVFDPRTQVEVMAYSRPVLIDNDIVREAMRRGENTLYAEVLKEKHPEVDLKDPHTMLTGGRYSRKQQLFDTVREALRTSMALRSME